MWDARTPGHTPGHPHAGCPSLESSWLPSSTGCYFLQNPLFFLPVFFLAFRNSPLHPSEQTLLSVIHKAASSPCKRGPSCHEPSSRCFSSPFPSPTFCSTAGISSGAGALRSLLEGEAADSWRCTSSVSQSLGGGGGNAWQEGEWMRRGDS